MTSPLMPLRLLPKVESSQDDAFVGVVNDECEVVIVLFLVSRCNHAPSQVE